MDEKLTVIKCDPPTSLIFGIDHVNLLQRPLSKVLNLPEGEVPGCRLCGLDAHTRQPTAKSWIKPSLI